jgi:hypothetical protein
VTLVSLSSIILGRAEGAPFPCGLTLPLATFAFFFTERWQRILLSRRWSNVFGVVVIVAVLAELVRGDTEARLLAGAHLIVYLSWIVLFQQKDESQYWRLCALSVMQIAVASVLTDEIIFGILVIGYLFLAVWTLALFSLQQARHQFALHAGNSGWPDDTALPTGRPVESSRMPSRIAAGSAIPFATRALKDPIRAEGAIQHDPQERWISPRFVIGILSTAACALFISVFFVILTPRIHVGRGLVLPESESGQHRVLTGFTEEVQLGDIGEILESTQRVIEIRLVDLETGQSVDVDVYTSQFGFEEPLFRGTVLGIYDEGRWREERLATEALESKAAVEGNKNIVRQEIRLEPIGTSILFAIHPVIHAEIATATDPVRIDRLNSIIRRPPTMLVNKHLDYTVYSPKPEQPIGDVRDETGFRIIPRLVGPAIRSHRAIDEENLQRLIQLARQVAGFNDEAGPPTQLEMAKRLSAYLAESGEYTYSLNAAIIDPEIDPVEDFLFNRKTGHCEYYASALALMLRATGIPSRLVSGFKGGVQNKLTGYYEVEERHAHAWVEANIDGRWVALDATPSLARRASVRSMDPESFSMEEIKRLVRGLWYTYIVNVKLLHQQTRLYEPLVEQARGWWQAIHSNPLEETTGEESHDADRQSSSRSWSRITAVTSGVLLLLFSTICIWFVWRKPTLRETLRALLHGKLSRGQTKIDFYERFATVCRRYGLVRASSQTQREFALDVGGAMNDLLSTAGLTEFPRKVADCFYHVRFGSEPLRHDESERLNALLDNFESCLAASKALRRINTGSAKSGGKPVDGRG